MLAERALTRSSAKSLADVLSIAIKAYHQDLS